MKIKTLAIVAILAAAGIGLYIKISNTPESVPPKEAEGTWEAPPSVDFGSFDAGTGGSLGTPLDGPGGTAPAFKPSPGGAAPAFIPASPGGQAPPFNGPGSGGAAPAFNSSPGGAAPPFNPTTPGSSAPPFNPSSNAPPFEGATPQSTAPPFNSTAPEVPDYRSPQNAAAPVGNGPTTNDPFVQATSASATVTGQPRHNSVEEAWADAQRLLSRNELSDALRILSPWYGDPSLTEAEQRELTSLLSQLAGSVIYSTEQHLGEPYVVKEGETLDSIAKAHQVTPNLLAKINGIANPNDVQPGARLKVVRGPFSALVSVEAREMVLVLDGQYAGRFRIGVGSERQQLEGNYVVKNKRVNPPYFGLDRTITGGDPENPLGAWWIGLGQDIENGVASQFGIHSTNDPASIERNDPRGFIRLAPEDAEDAYDILSVGSRVLIRR